MKKILLLLVCCSLTLVPFAWASEEAELNEAIAVIESLFEESQGTVPASNAYWKRNGDKVDIYDIFVRSLPEVDLTDPDIQFFVDLLPSDSRVFVQTAPDGTRTFTYLSKRKFGCIAKILPAVPGVKPELYMHIENCQMSRSRRSGTAVTNYIRNTVHKADGTMVKDFNSTATWTFHHITDTILTDSNGVEYDDFWSIETLIVNTLGPSMVQYYAIEGTGIVAKRKATVSW